MSCGQFIRCLKFQTREKGKGFCWASQEERDTTKFQILTFCPRRSATYCTMYRVEQQSSGVSLLYLPKVSGDSTHPKNFVIEISDFWYQVHKQADSQVGYLIVIFVSLMMFVYDFMVLLFYQPKFFKKKNSYIHSTPNFLDRNCMHLCQHCISLS